MVLTPPEKCISNTATMFGLLQRDKEPIKFFYFSANPVLQLRCVQKHLAITKISFFVVLIIRGNFYTAFQKFEIYVIITFYYFI